MEQKNLLKIILDHVFQWVSFQWDSPVCESGVIEVWQIDVSLVFWYLIG